LAPEQPENRVRGYSKYPYVNTLKAQRANWKLQIQPLGEDTITKNSSYKGIDRRFPDYFLSRDPKKSGH